MNTTNILPLSFDLLTEPWIPVVGIHGGAKRVRMRDLFRDAATLREIYSDSPLINLGVLRVLLAVVHASCREESDTAANELWKTLWADTSGAMLAYKVTQYLNQFVDRFDLFHPVYPFYQCGVFRTAESINVCNLTADESGDFFNHSFKKVRQGYSPADAALLLIGAQCASVDGLVRRDALFEDGKVEPCFRSYKAPFYNNTGVFLQGETLYETLLLNFVSEERPEDDLPAWERSGAHELRDAVNEKSRPTHRSRGICDRLTWQSRLIRFMPEETEDGLHVWKMFYGHCRTTDDTPTDPMMAYRKTENGWLPFRLQAEKAAWRNLHAITRPGRQDVSIAPMILRHVADLVGYDDLAKADAVQIGIAGLASETGKAMVHLWRQERVAVPPTILLDAALAEKLEQLMGEADNTQGNFDKKNPQDSVPSGVAISLFRRTKDLCKLFLSPNADDPNARQPDPKDIERLANDIDPRPTYWAHMEGHFYALLHELPTDANAAGEKWRDAAEREARRALLEACDGLGYSASSASAMRVIQAMARVSADFSCGKRGRIRNYGKLADLAERRDDALAESVPNLQENPDNAGN